MVPPGMCTHCAGALRRNWAGAVSSHRSGAYAVAACDCCGVVARLLGCLHPSSAPAHPGRNTWGRRGISSMAHADYPPLASGLNQTAPPRCEQRLPQHHAAPTLLAREGRDTRGDRDCDPDARPPCASTHASDHQLPQPAWQLVRRSLRCTCRRPSPAGGMQHRDASKRPRKNPVWPQCFSLSAVSELRERSTVAQPGMTQA